VDYLAFTATVICIWIMMSLATNLVVGYAGMMSIGHVAYLAIGAYTTGILNLFFGVPYWATIPIAIVVTAIVALVTVLPLLRLSAFYFGLATLGLNVVIVDLIHNVAPRVQGAEGLLGMTIPAVMTNAEGRLAIVALLTLACALACRRLVASPFGRSLRALRDAPAALASIGKEPNLYRIAIWTISGAIAGLAGALYAATLSYIDPTVFVVLYSFNLLVYIGFGGLASIWGSVLGPLILIAFGESLRFMGLPSEISAPVEQALFALLLIFVMLFRRRGLVGQYDIHD